MRTIEDYMAMPYRMEIVEDSDEGGFVASYPAGLHKLRRNG